MHKPTLLKSLFGILLLSASLSAGAQSYCMTGGPTSLADTEIRNVFLQGDNYGISNPTTCPAVLGVRDFTLIDSADVSRGTSYTLEALMGTCGGNYSSFGRVWMDYNADGDFDDAGEELGTWGSSLTAPQSATVFNAAFAFTVPLNAPLGRTRLRVMLYEDGTAATATPCASYQWGSVHDYTVRVTNTPPACPIPGSLSMTGISATQATLNYLSAGSAFDIQYGAPGFTAPEPP
jgi:trimeric autotransporter adhesin